MLGRIVKIEAVAPGVRALWLESPRAAAGAAPGQFIMLDGGPGRTTRRPFSVSGADPERGVLRVTVRAAGPGSSWVAGRPEGGRVGFHGPLGRGFAPPPDGGEVWLVAGGIGVAPLLFLAVRLRAEGRRVWAAVGGRTAADAWGAAELAALGCGTEVTTEDGSAGTKGLVTSLVEARLHDAAGRPATIYACGPRGMLVAVAAAALGAGVHCEVSVEERMACGVGACAGCTWPEGLLAAGLALRPAGVPESPPGVGEGGRPLRVCRDGPCFEVVKAWA